MLDFVKGKVGGAVTGVTFKEDTSTMHSSHLDNTTTRTGKKLGKDTKTKCYQGR